MQAADWISHEKNRPNFTDFFTDIAHWQQSPCLRTSMQLAALQLFNTNHVTGVFVYFAKQTVCSAENGLISNHYLSPLYFCFLKRLAYESLSALIMAYSYNAPQSWIHHVDKTLTIHGWRTIQTIKRRYVQKDSIYISNLANVNLGYVI